jgi:hypothetical protein
MYIHFDSLTNEAYDAILATIKNTFKHEEGCSLDGVSYAYVQEKFEGSVEYRRNETRSYSVEPIRRCPECDALVYEGKHNEKAKKA